MRLRHRSWIWVARCLAVLVVGASPALIDAVERGSDGSALAQPGPPQVPITQCSLRGEVVMPADAAIFDALGHPIARFSGASTPIVAGDFPSDAQGEVRIETGFGTGSFRIRGFMPSSQLPIFTAQNLMVVPGHVWIPSGRTVTLMGAGSGRLRVEKRLSAPFQQTFHASGACNAFSLGVGNPSGFTPAGNARGYQLKQESLDLFPDASGQNPVTSLRRSPYVDAVLFFSSERRGAFVHIEYHGDIVIDGWAKSDALSALPPGETMDELAPATNQRSAPHLSVPGEPRLLRLSREVPLRRTAKDAEQPIGVIEPGTETYVLDQVAGWASVLPKSLNVLPATDAQFWAKSSDLGL